MLKRIIDFSIGNKLIIWMMLITLVVYGSYELTRLPIDAVPDITDNQVQVITVSPSLGAPDVERFITFPIELANSNIPGLKEIRSFSRFGLSVVTIVFNEGVDVYWARTQVSERLQVVRTQIPDGMGSPELAPVTTGLGEIYQYILRPKPGYEDKYDAMELRTIQDWIIRRQLLGVSGVADVSSFGGYLKQYEVAVDPMKIASYGISLKDLTDALQRNNENTGGAYIEKGPEVLFIRTEGLRQTLEDIRSITVKTQNDGTPVRVKDVASVGFGHATRYGAMFYNGKYEVAGGVVMMLKGANSKEVIKRIKEKVETIRKTLPEGVVMEAFLDRTKMVDNAIGTVQQNLIEGALIVVFVLVIFLGNFRAGLLVASVIPLSMLFAVIMMNLFGVSGNLMSLGALDFGLIVDGAVIIVEAVMHQLAHAHEFGDVRRLNQQQMDTTVGKAAGRMMNSAVFGQIIILIVYLPIFTLEGIEGKMFKPMAQTVAFALLGAFILSLTYVPMMSSIFISKKLDHKPNLSDRLMAWLERIYVRFLGISLKLRGVMLASVLLLFSVAILLLMNMGGEFIPSLEEGDFAVETRVMTGSNLGTSLDKVKIASQVLMERFPEVEMVVGKTGSSEIPTDPMPIEASDLMVILKPKEEWTSATTFPELAEKMSTALKDVPGASFGFQYPVQMRFNELMTGARQDVVVKIFGEDMDTLAAYADKLGGIIQGIDGAKDVYIEKVTGMQQIVVRPNMLALAQYGLDVSTVNATVNAAFAGQVTGAVFEGERRFDLVVRLEDQKRMSIEDVAGLLVPTASGQQVPLRQIATVTEESGASQIQREDAKRRIIVGFNVRGRDVQSIMHDLQELVNRKIRFPAGYYPTYGGTFENLEAAKSRLMVAVPISLVMIFLMLYFAFGSLRHSMLIYTAIPLSAIGGILALFTRSMPFSISAGIGFIALFGVAVLNGIVLISEFNRIKQEKGGSLSDIVIEGARLRLRPVLMTACVASLGFLPMAISNGSGAEVQRPLATVVIGGLVVATFLTLFILPVLYTMFEKKVSTGTLATGVLILFLLSQSSAQTPISLGDALDSAMHNNQQIRTASLEVQYLELLGKTAWNLPQTDVYGEFGQINSYFKDTKVGLSQSIQFPTVYVRQQEMLDVQKRSGQWRFSRTQKEVQRDVARAYAALLVTRQRVELLTWADSLYTKFEAYTDLRFNLGEANILQKTTAQSQRGQIRMQLDGLKQEYQLQQLQLSLLLNSPVLYIPSEGMQYLDFTELPDTTRLGNHPILKVLSAEKDLASGKLKHSKSMLLPGLTIGYYNQSIRGYQQIGENVRFFTPSNRFSAFQVGIGIPLLSGTGRKLVHAMETQVLIREQEYAFWRQLLHNQYFQTFTKWQTARMQLDWYHTTGLVSAEALYNGAQQQFQQGAINYLEWVMLVNQAIEIRAAFLETLRQYQDAVIDLSFLSSTPIREK